MIKNEHNTCPRLLLSACIRALFPVVGVILVLSGGSLTAREIEFRLVPYDHPEATVDTLEKQQPILNPVRTERGFEMQKIGLDIVCWSRNVLLDGQPLFERYYEKKYIDRLPRAKRELPAGRHVLWPGEQAFTVKPDGSVAAESPELLVEGDVLKIKAYPVTVRAYLANPEDADLPQVMRVAPLPNVTLRDAAESAAFETARDAAKKEGKSAPPNLTPRELVPVFDQFSPLTIWLPAHRAGRGYVLYPMGLTFQLGPDGISAGAGGGEPPMQGVGVGKWEINVPLYGFPVTGDRDSTVIIEGVEQFSWASYEDKLAKPTHWYPRRQGYEIRLSPKGPALHVDGNLQALPRKALRVDVPDIAAGVQRGLLAELPSPHFKPGETVAVRIQAVDPGVPTKPGTTKADAGQSQDVNLLADAVPFGRLQLYGDAQWIEAEVKPGADGRISLVVPNLDDGLYRLELGVRPRDGARPSISAELWITVTKPRTMSAGLFTQRGRDAFYRGESFWIGAGVLAIGQPVPAGTPLQVELVDSENRRFVLFKDALAAPVKERQTFVVRLDGPTTLKLAPGRYRVEARLGATTARPLAIDLIDPEQRTHFDNIMIGKYGAEGKQYEHAILSGRGAEDLVRNIVSLGCNGFQGMSYSMERVVRPDVGIEQLVRERPELGPWESYYQPSGRDRFLNAAVRHNLRVWENLFTYNDTSLPRGDKIVAASARYAGLETHAMEHSPAFRGVCLYDEIYTRSLNDGVAVVTAFDQAMELGYRAQVPGLTSAKAFKALDRYAGRPFGQRSVQDLETYRTRPAYEDECWRQWCEILTASVKAVMPSSRNFALNRYFGSNGSNIGVFGKEEDVYGPLDYAACVMYKDGGYGDRPVFGPMQADVMRVSDTKPVWTQIHDFNGPGVYGQHLLRQAFFGLSQKIDGFTYFCLSNDRDAVKNIAGELCTTYGDFFLTLGRGYKQVAIYYSRTAQYLGPRKLNSLSHQCEGLWVACARAGFPADFLRDGDILAGRGMEYGAVFVPGFTYEDECPPKILAEIKRLVNAGKTVLVERSSRLPVEGVVRLNSEMDEYDDKTGGAFPRHVDFETDMVWDQTEEMTKIVREALAKRVPPAARHNLIVGPDWLKCGDGQYMVLPNFNPAVFRGLYRTLYQAPDRPRIEFPRRPPVCYDVLEMRRANVKSDGDWMSVEADMSHYPGKILAFVPEPISSVRLDAKPAVAAGGTLSYAVSVLGPQGQPIHASFPLRIRIADAAGKRIQEIYRAAAPEFHGAYAVPVNVEAGTWRIQVQELMSGSTAEATVTLQAGGTVAGATDTRKVHLNDPARLAEFLSRKDKDILIPLEPEQGWVKPVAERLCQALARRGMKTKIVEAGVVTHPPGPWESEQAVFDGTRLWRGNVVQPGFFLDGPVLLLGKRGENRLVEALIQRDALAELPSAGFPGPGRALVAWTRRAFSVDFDAVSILADDAEGLAAGVEAFLGADGKSGSEPVAPQLVVAKPENAGLAAGRSAARETSSFADRIRGEDRVCSLDLDTKTGRVLAGTFGYGENLFCLGRDGKLLWKTYLPEHDVYFARWYDDGKRVVAATGRGWFVFLLDGADGKVLRRFAATEWPDTHYSEGAQDTRVQIEINPGLRQILIGGRTGLLAVDYDGRRMWFLDRTAQIVAIPKEADQSTAAAQFPVSAALGNFAVSPDGLRIVYGEHRVVGTTIVMKQLTDLWAFRPKILDAKTGQILYENAEDPGNQAAPTGWQLRWPADSKTPWFDTQGLTASIGEDGKRGPLSTLPGAILPGGDSLVTSATSVERRNPKGVTLWQWTGEGIFAPELDRLAPGQARLYRCDEDGTVDCLDLARGVVVWQRPLPFCATLHAVPDGVVAGTVNGTVARLGADGSPAWQVSLRALHEPPTGDYDAYVRTGLRRDPDSTAEFFPVGEDKPGDYDQVLRLGIEQLANGGFEQEGAWSADGKPAPFGGPGHQGQRALRAQPGMVVTQTLDRRVIPLGTYLLEFFYRPLTEGAQVTAGTLLTGDKETFTASTWSGRTGEWHFARLAVKTLVTTRQLQVGFEAVGGEVLVDDVSLRPVRFPSANLLAQPELHAVEPTFVRDLRVRFNHIPPELKQKLVGQNHVAAFKQGGTNSATMYTEEEAFLHNGRLDDVGPVWVYQPDEMGFSVVLVKPAWVSHLVLYLNNANAEDAYRTIAILANNVETKISEVVALVRNNRRRFVVVYFPKPLLTDVIKILPGKSLRAHHETLTEVEVYGPVGGPETGRTKGFPADPSGWPMLMAAPSHVPGSLPSDLTGDYRVAGQMDLGHPAFFSGAVAAGNLMVFGDPNGVLRTVKIVQSDPKERYPDWGPSWSVGTITPTTVPAWYAGRLLVGSADEKMHAVAENGAQLWAFQTGGRVYSSPTPSGDDVFFGSDDGSLYRVDVDSGILLWEFKTGGKVRAAPALAEGRVFAPSWAGFLYAVTAESGQPIWKAAIARHTRAAPAVQGARVYLGDEEGHMRCFQAADGKPIYDQALGGRIPYCPVAGSEGVLFASEQGHLGFVGADGQVKWKRNLETEVTGQPVGTKTQLLIPTMQGIVVLRQADGQPDGRIRMPEQPGRVIAALPYGGRLCLLAGGATTLYGYGPVTYAQYWARAVIWAPQEPPKPAGGQK